MLRGDNGLFSSGSCYRLVDNPSLAEGADGVDVVPRAGFSCPPHRLSADPMADRAGGDLQAAEGNRSPQGPSGAAARMLPGSHTGILIAPHKDQLLL